MRMRHIFISYKREDTEFALKLRQALRAEKLNVWWDEDLQTGEKWEERIDKALMFAEAIIVIWSNRSIDSEWVKHEASIGKIRGILTHSLIDGCDVPAPFKSIQAINLSDWNGQEKDKSFVNLVGSVRNIYRKRISKGFQKAIVYSVVVIGLVVYSLVFRDPLSSLPNATIEKITEIAKNSGHDIGHINLLLDLSIDIKNAGISRIWTDSYSDEEDEVVKKKVESADNIDFMAYNGDNFFQFANDEFEKFFEKNRTRLRVLVANPYDPYYVSNTQLTLRDNPTLETIGFDEATIAAGIGKLDHLIDRLSCRLAKGKKSLEIKIFNNELRNPIIIFDGTSALVTVRFPPAESRQSFRMLITGKEHIRAITDHFDKVWHLSKAVRQVKGVKNSVGRCGVPTRASIN